MSDVYDETLDDRDPTICWEDTMPETTDPAPRSVSECERMGLLPSVDALAAELARCREALRSVATWLEHRIDHYQNLGSYQVAADLHAQADRLRVALS